MPLYRSWEDEDGEKLQARQMAKIRPALVLVRGGERLVGEMQLPMILVNSPGANR